MMQEAHSPENKVRFRCPHCHAVLAVDTRHVGAKGRCNRCQGHIALLGPLKGQGIPLASAVAEEPPETHPQAPTPKQLEYLRAMGATQGQLDGLSREGASKLIDRLRQARGLQAPATPKQLVYLRQLGATDKQLQAIKSQAAASEMIEAMHLQPSGEQLALLKKLGASGAQIAKLRSRGEASALIDDLRIRK